jgi:hypothetical protein
MAHGGGSSFDDVVCTVGVNFDGVQQVVVLVATTCTCGTSLYATVLLVQTGW